MYSDTIEITEQVVLKMKKAKRRKESELLRMRSSVLAITKRLSEHCNKVRALVDSFEAAQINTAEFSLSQLFYTTTSEMMTKAINDLSEAYETLRRDVREFAQIGYLNFENLFPERNINFETYYPVATSLLNQASQMQLMRLCCYRLLRP
jgi:hypothetical protein